MEIFETINSDYSYSHLTKDQRTKIISTLSNSQRQTIEQYKRYKINSMLLNKFNETGTEWRFLEQRTNLNFDQSNPSTSTLHCSCGRGVKYLYICKSKDSQEIKSFGKNHLEQEAGISSAVLSDIRKGEHKIDRGLDEILIRIDNNDEFPYLAYEVLLQQKMLNSLFPTSKLQYLDMFYKEGLPIYRDDQNIIVKEVKQILKKDSEREYQNWLKTPEGINYLEAQEAKKKHEEEQERIKLERQRVLADERIQLNNTEKSLDPEQAKQTIVELTRKKVLENAKITFRQVFAHHKDIAEQYGFDGNNDMDVLIINGIFNSGSSVPGKAIIPKETVIDLVNRLAQKFGYEIDELEQRINEIYGILEHVGITQKHRNIMVASY